MLAFATADLDAVVADWHAWLASERRLAARSVVAYRRDLAAFVTFLGGADYAKYLAKEREDLTALLKSIGKL